MSNQTKDHSQTTAITLTQLAAIAGRDPSFFSLHKDELPEPVPIYDGTHGRPQLAYSIEALAELIVERVGHLTNQSSACALPFLVIVHPSRRIVRVCKA